jgi:hypothetical protein
MGLRRRHPTIQHLLGQPARPLPVREMLAERVIGEMEKPYQLIGGNRRHRLQLPSQAFALRIVIGPAIAKQCFQQGTFPLSSRNLGPQPPQFGLGAGVFDERFWTVADGFLKTLFGERAVALQELPFADIKQRLAALLRLLRGGKRCRRIAPPEIEFEHWIGPVAAVDTPRRGFKTGGSLAGARLRQEAKQARIGEKIVPHDVRQIRRRVHEVAAIKMHVTAIAKRCHVLRIDRDHVVVVGDRPVVIAGFLIGKAAAGIALGVLGLDRERNDEIRDRAVIIALLDIGVAAIPVSIGVPGLQWPC